MLEIGFGLGLNALLTADLALDLATDVPPEHRPVISYHAFEHDLIGAQYFKSLGYEAVLNHPELAASMADMLGGSDAGNSAPISCDRNLTCGFHQTCGFHVTLHLEDATAANCGFFTGSKNTFHAIYLDAFCPEANPECWTTEFIARLAEMLSDDGFLSTYSAKGSVRRAMLQAGLQVKKLPGPPGKREMLLAHR